jgi:hypothetical protein
MEMTNIPKVSFTHTMLLQQKKKKKKKKKKTRKGRGKNDIMLLNQEQTEVPKWNSPVIRCEAQV